MYVTKKKLLAPTACALFGWSRFYVPFPISAGVTGDVQVVVFVSYANSSRATTTILPWARKNSTSPPSVAEPGSKFLLRCAGKST